MLTCTVSGHLELLPTVLYQWFKEDLKIMEGSSLIFEPVDRNDTGNYTCIATINSTLLFSVVEEMDATAVFVTGVFNKTSNNLFSSGHPP